MHHGTMATMEDRARTRGQRTVLTGGGHAATEGAAGVARATSVMSKDGQDAGTNLGWDLRTVAPYTRTRLVRLRINRSRGRNGNPCRYANHHSIVGQHPFVCLLPSAGRLLGQSSSDLVYAASPLTEHTSTKQQVSKVPLGRGTPPWALLGIGGSLRPKAGPRTPVANPP